MPPRFIYLHFNKPLFILNLYHVMRVRDSIDGNGAHVTLMDGQKQEVDEYPEVVQKMLEDMKNA